MTTQTEVTIDYAIPRIDWGIPDDAYPSHHFTLNIRELEIQCSIHGVDTLRKSAIRTHLQRGLKYFIREKRLHPYVQYKKTVLYRMANYSNVSFEDWAELIAFEFDNRSHYNIWMNIARPEQLLVMDEHNRTGIVSNTPTLLHNKPVALEFVRSEGGVLFNYHQLGLDARAHQAEAGLKLRRDTQRRTRGGSHYAVFGLLDIRQINSTSTEVWVGEDHLWTVGPNGTTGKLALYPNTQHFLDWEAGFAIQDVSAGQYLLEFTLQQLSFISPE